MAAEEERLLEVSGAVEDPRRHGADGAALGLLLPYADGEAEAVHGRREVSDGLHLDGEEAAEALHSKVSEGANRLPVPYPLLLRRSGSSYRIEFPVGGFAEVFIGVGELGAGTPGGEGEGHAAGAGAGVGCLWGGAGEGEGGGAAAGRVGRVERLAEGLELMEEVGVGVLQVRCLGHLILELKVVVVVVDEKEEKRRWKEGIYRRGFWGW